MKTSEKTFDEFEELVLELDMARIIFAEEEEEEEARIVVSIKDITERKRAEEALRESEERYRQLFEAESDAIVLIDNATGCILEANSAAAALYGYSKEELLSKKNSDLSAEPEETQRVTQTTPVDVNRVVTVPLRFHRKQDGSVFPVEITGRFLIRQGRSVHLAAIRDITERKRAEDALRQAEENFRHSLDDSPLGVRIVTMEGETIYTNRAILEIYGYDSIEELRTTPVKKRYTPESYAEFQIRKKKRQQGEYDPPEYEISIVRKNGEIRHLQVFRKEALWNGERQFQAIYLDITERKRAEEALQEGKEFVENLIASMQDGVSVLDSYGVHIDVNAAFCQMTGFSREELIGVGTPHPYWPPEAHEETERAFQKTLRGEFSDIEVTFMRKNGERFPVIVSPSWVKDKQGNVTSYFATVKDITERKRAEEALRRKSGEQDLLLDNIQTQIWYLTDKETYGAVNKARAEFFGKKNEEMENKKLYNVLSKDEAEICMSGYAEVFEKRKQIYTEEWITNAKGEKRLLSIIKSPKLDENGDVEYVVCSAEDITERKRVEEERERLLAEIAAKNQELESFAYTISHDLRSPLVSLDGFSSLLKRESQNQLGKQGQHYLERIRANVAHMNTLVTELLALSRIGRVVGPEEEIDVGVLLREIEEGLVLKLEQEGVEFIVQQPLPAARGDRGRIRQVFANLIENAVKFRSLERRLRIEVGCEEEKGFYRFHVGDNGIGISPQYQEQIFESFRQLDRGIEGMGMGLTLVKRIVEHHGGRVWVESEAGKGATFYFTIPDRHS